MDKEFSTSKVVVRRGFIGQMLLKKGLITSNQLEEALSIQKRESARLLGDILIQKGFISEELLYMMLAAQSDLCFVPVERYKITTDILQLIPKELASKYSLIPLEKIAQVLTVAIAGWLNLKEAISTIEGTTHYKVVCVIGTKTQIEKIIRLHYSSD